MIITHRRNACMIGKHQTADAMISDNIWRLSGQSYLYGCRAPRYEIRKLPLAYSQERLVNLDLNHDAEIRAKKYQVTNIRWIYISLDNIQNGNIASSFARSRGDHAIFRLEQPSHNIKYCSSSNGFRLKHFSIYAK